MFDINGENFSQLYYLVDSIYPSLSRFLSTIDNLMKALNCFFAPREERFHKPIKRAICVWKRKFLSVGLKVSLHDHEDIYYLVRAPIVMHNMIVEEYLCHSEHESDDFYKVGDVNSEDDSSVESVADFDSSNACKFLADFDAYDLRDNILKYKIIQQR